MQSEVNQEENLYRIITVPSPKFHLQTENLLMKICDFYVFAVSSQK